MKTHYELLGLEPSADGDAIKKAFRREIARYHPDKVIHLGAEFQEIAATRAAELTVAYKTLTDPAQREQYDAAIAAGVPPADIPTPPRPQPAVEFKPAAEPEGRLTPPPAGVAGSKRFASERADRDSILKRAVVTRVLGIAEGLYGKLDTPAVRGFDLGIVPQAKPRFLGTAPPRVLLKVVETADANAISESFADASRSRVHLGKSPVIVLLCSRQVAPQLEITKAHDANARQRKAPGGPAEVAVVVVDISDWSCRLPPQCSAAVRTLVDEIC